MILGSVGMFSPNSQTHLRANPNMQAAPWDHQLAPLHSKMFCAIARALGSLEDMYAIEKTPYLMSILAACVTMRSAVPPHVAMVHQH